MATIVKTERKILDDRIITIKEISEDRCIDFSDIVTNVKYDEYMNEAPWDSCDGWEHDCYWLPHSYYSEYDDIENARGYGYSCSNRSRFLITIDDSTVIDKWGHNRRNGESAQVWRERVARVKRDAIDQLVKWYSDGWEWWLAVAEYPGGPRQEGPKEYMHCVGGIDSEEYAEKVALECAFDVATDMEIDGYIITNRPEQENHYDRHASFKWRLKHNLQTW